MLFRPGTNSTNDQQEEINEAISDFSGSLLTKGSKQHVAHCIRMPTQFVERFGCRSLSIEGDDSGRDTCEEIGRQSKLHQNAELINLVEDTFQSNRAWIGFQVLPGDGGLTGGRQCRCWLIIESLFFLLKGKGNRSRLLACLCPYYSQPEMETQSSSGKKDFYAMPSL
ncbi:MAG TPA: hypothetical protein VKU38_01435, partial [Ktedonobacteraceae bacterium]|nr:hypothetical protein [Ktedonobacteraceae bacterium]